MNHNCPRVTVLMPVYNGEKYLREAMDSVLSQTFTDFELLIINDGSTDHSVEIINSYRDSRIRLIHNEQNLKLIATLNKGLELARGEYIARMDADDICLPERLAEQVKYMDEHPDIGVCGTWVRVFARLTGYDWHLPVSADEVKSYLFFQSPLAHPTVMLRGAKFRELNLKYNPEHIHAEDYGLWLACSKYFPMANVPKVLLKYRHRNSSVSRANASVRDQTVKRLISSNLDDLGIDASAGSGEAHWAVVFNKIESKATVEMVEKWLRYIKEVNRKVRRYPEVEFARTVDNRWLAFCNSAAWLGPWTYRICVNSPLSSCFSAKQRVTLILKCLLRCDYKNLAGIKSLLSFK